MMEENLSHLVLLLKRLDIADMGQCKFLDRPGTVKRHSSFVVLQLVGQVFIILPSLLSSS